MNRNRLDLFFWRAERDEGVAAAAAALVGRRQLLWRETRV